VDACTAAAFDVITAFAVPNPNIPSPGGRFFQVWLPSGLPLGADHPAYFGLRWLRSPVAPFSRRRRWEYVRWGAESTPKSGAFYVDCITFLWI